MHSTLIFIFFTPGQNLLFRPLFHNINKAFPVKYIYHPSNRLLYGAGCWHHLFSTPTKTNPYLVTKAVCTLPLPAKGARLRKMKCFTQAPALSSGVSLTWISRKPFREMPNGRTELFWCFGVLVWKGEPLRVLVVESWRWRVGADKRISKARRVMCYRKAGLEIWGRRSGGVTPIRCSVELKLPADRRRSLSLCLSLSRRRPYTVGFLRPISKKISISSHRAFFFVPPEGRRTNSSEQKFCISDFSCFFPPFSPELWVICGAGRPWGSSVAVEDAHWRDKKPSRTSISSALMMLLSASFFPLFFSGSYFSRIFLRVLEYRWWTFRKIDLLHLFFFKEEGKIIIKYTNLVTW